MTEHTPLSNPKPAEILGEIGADRPCASCGFNLHGQTITRDPHYAMPIARCPECGTVAALQEYPALGRWANRWAAVLAATWLAVLVALFAATTAFSLVQFMGYVESMSDLTAEALAQAQSDWASSLPPDERDMLHVPDTVRGNVWDPIIESWPGADNPRAIIDAHGGPVVLIEWRYGWFWIFSALYGLVVGAIWSVALLHQPRWRVALVPIVAIAIALAIFATTLRVQTVPWMPVRSLVLPIVAPYIAGCTAAVLIASIAAGCHVGRPLARLVIRMALPPRLRVPFAPLWTAAAKPLPKPR